MLTPARSWPSLVPIFALVLVACSVAGTTDSPDASRASTPPERAVRSFHEGQTGFSLDTGNSCVLVEPSGRIRVSVGPGTAG
jgi:hypothetical protein